MLYMVELDFADPSREAEWTVWYSAHLVKLLSMPGFRTAQRFRAVTPGPSPFLAIYQVDSPAAFTSPEYTSRAGPSAPGEWIPLMIDWHRNLFDGIDVAPDVPMDRQLLVVDRRTSADPPLPEGLHVLRGVGLDRTVFERGIAVGDAAAVRAIHQRVDPASARIMVPLTRRLGPGDRP